MKKWIALLCVLVLCINLAACGKTNALATDAALTDLKDQTLRLGGQMPNFVISDALGNEYTLYDLLEEKKMVMLNFWFIDCPYCVMEFPSIQQAYSQYQDQVAILAVNPYDAASSMVGFGQQYGLQFTLCPDGPGLSEAFGVTGYPTTVVIDRNGMICLLQAGAVPYEEVFLRMFAYFTAEDYRSEVLYNMQRFM